MDVSIIIPVYNVAPYIEECLLSVMGQSYVGEMECLIVDDCGTDDSIIIAQRLIDSYEGSIRFEIVQHKQNRGLSAARNTGMGYASGEYIFFLDSDDWLEVDCIAKLMTEALSDLAIEMVQGNMRSVPERHPDPCTLAITIPHAKNNEEVRSCLFQFNQYLTAAHNKLYKRSFLQKHQLMFKEGIIFEDVVWRFYILQHLTNAYFCPEITYNYRVRPNSIITGSKRQSIANSVRVVYNEIITHLTEGHEKEEFNYYAVRFVDSYCFFDRYDTGLRDVFQLYWENRKEYGCLSVKMKLAMCHYFGTPIVRAIRGVEGLMKQATRALTDRR